MNLTRLIIEVYIIVIIDIIVNTVKYTYYIIVINTIFSES